MQQPGCPNFYWALTDLPSPLVDLRKGAQGERTSVASELRLLRDDTVMSEAQIEEFVSRLSGGIGFAREQAGQPPRNLRALLTKMAKDDELVRVAGKRLIESGGRLDQVGRFSAVQVILLDQKRDYDILRDEEMKLLALAPWQIDSLVPNAETVRSHSGLFDDLLPHVLEARRAQGRLERRIALLRHIEALRLYAAEHDGKLPAKLGDIPLPLPVDPFTGKPFEYTANGATARLRGKSPAEEIRPGYVACYAVTIQK